MFVWIEDNKDKVLEYENFNNTGLNWLKFFYKDYKVNNFITSPYYKRTNESNLEVFKNVYVLWFNIKLLLILATKYV